MSYINAGITLILFTIGWFVKVKKVTWLISGYNTLSDENKAEYDIEKLTRHMGNFIYLLAAVWCVMSILGFIFPEKIGFIMLAGMIVLAIVIVGGVIWLNTDVRVKKD